MADDYVPYPKVLYHATEAPVTVADAQAHDALGPEWAEAPITDEAPADEAPKPKKKGR